MMYAWYINLSGSETFMIMEEYSKLDDKHTTIVLWWQSLGEGTKQWCGIFCLWMRVHTLMHGRQNHTYEIKKLRCRSGCLWTRPYLTLALMETYCSINKEQPNNFPTWLGRCQNNGAHWRVTTNWNSFSIATAKGWKFNLMLWSMGRYQ